MHFAGEMGIIECWRKIENFMCVSTKKAELYFTVIYLSHHWNWMVENWMELIIFDQINIENLEISVSLLQQYRAAEQHCNANF